MYALCRTALGGSTSIGRGKRVALFNVDAEEGGTNIASVKPMPERAMQRDERRSMPDGTQTLGARLSS